MTGRIDPAWGDDLMAIADATREPAPFHLHPSVREVISDDQLEAVVAEWAGDQPIPYIPTDHEPCGGCGIALCGCDVACDGMDGDACGHRSAPLCPDCSGECRECRIGGLGR